MNGLNIKEVGPNIIIEINFLSDELKEKIKNELVSICHGEFALISESIHLSYERTINELINHRLSKQENRKKGAIGELLLNVIIRHYTDMKIVSPFFNMEERNVKKGFDIITIDRKNLLWIVESKAGELSKEDTATKKVIERINKAKYDLQSRLNKENSQLWLNAINSVRKSLNDGSEKKTIIKILEITSNTSTSTDKNVVLGGTVFCLFDTRIDSNEIKKLYDNILESNIFGEVKLIAIQKQTYQEVIYFLEGLI